MLDLFAGAKSANLLTPYTHAVVVTPDDNTPLAFLPRAIYVCSAGGNITMTLAEDSAAVLFTALPIGLLQVRPKIIKATGTSSTPILALW